MLEGQVSIAQHPISGRGCPIDLIFDVESIACTPFVGH